MKQRAVVALGFFDGVHLGHAALARTVRQRADALSLRAVATTFDRHPQSLNGAAVKLLTTQAERERLLREHCGMDAVIFLRFDEALQTLPWERFLDEILVGQLDAAWVVCGYNYRFGKGGAGTAELLAAACAVRGMGCDIVPQVTLDAQAVSSTAIRSLIAAGELSRATRLLGHPYRLCGTVIHGEALGRRLGTPTANLTPDPALVCPKHGVYISHAHTPHGSYAAVTNIGNRPTVHGEGTRIEAWLLDFAGDLYGQELCIDLCEFLRPEQKFDSISALQAEIMKNAAQARAYFAQRGIEGEEPL